MCVTRLFLTVLFSVSAVCKFGVADREVVEIYASRTDEASAARHGNLPSTAAAQQSFHEQQTAAAEQAFPQNAASAREAELKPAAEEPRLAARHAPGAVLGARGGAERPREERAAEPRPSGGDVQEATQQPRRARSFLEKRPGRSFLETRSMEAGHLERRDKKDARGLRNLRIRPLKSKATPALLQVQEGVESRQERAENPEWLPSTADSAKTKVRLGVDYDRSTQSKTFGKHAAQHGTLPSQPDRSAGDALGPASDQDASQGDDEKGQKQDLGVAGGGQPEVPEYSEGAAAAQPESDGDAANTGEQDAGDDAAPEEPGDSAAPPLSGPLRLGKEIKGRPTNSHFGQGLSHNQAGDEQDEELENELPGGDQHGPEYGDAGNDQGNGGGDAGLERSDLADSDGGPAASMVPEESEVDAALAKPPKEEKCEQKIMVNCSTRGTPYPTCDNYGGRHAVFCYGNQPRYCKCKRKFCVHDGVCQKKGEHSPKEKQPAKHAFLKKKTKPPKKPKRSKKVAAEQREEVPPPLMKEGRPLAELVPAPSGPNEERKPAPDAPEPVLPEAPESVPEVPPQDRGPQKLQELEADLEVANSRLGEIMEESDRQHDLATEAQRIGEEEPRDKQVFAAAHAEEEAHEKVSQEAAEEVQREAPILGQIQRKVELLIVAVSTYHYTPEQDARVAEAEGEVKRVMGTLDAFLAALRSREQALSAGSAGAPSDGTAPDEGGGKDDFAGIRRDAHLTLAGANPVADAIGEDYPSDLNPGVDGGGGGLFGPAGAALGSAPWGLPSPRVAGGPQTNLGQVAGDVADVLEAVAAALGGDQGGIAEASREEQLEGLRGRLEAASRLNEEVRREAREHGQLADSAREGQAHDRASEHDRISRDAHQQAHAKEAQIAALRDMIEDLVHNRDRKINVANDEIEALVAYLKNLLDKLRRTKLWPGGPCNARDSTSCGHGLACVGGTCKAEAGGHCEAEQDCVDGHSCVDKKCQAPWDASGDIPKAGPKDQVAALRDRLGKVKERLRRAEAAMDAWRHFKAALGRQAQESGPEAQRLEDKFREAAKDLQDAGNAVNEAERIVSTLDNEGDRMPSEESADLASQAASELDSAERALDRAAAAAPDDLYAQLDAALKDLRNRLGQVQKVHAAAEADLKEDLAKAHDFGEAEAAGVLDPEKLQQRSGALGDLQRLLGDAGQELRAQGDAARAMIGPDGVLSRLSKIDELPGAEAANAPAQAKAAMDDAEAGLRKLAEMVGAAEDLAMQISPQYGKDMLDGEGKAGLDGPGSTHGHHGSPHRGPHGGPHSGPGGPGSAEDDPSLRRSNGRPGDDIVPREGKFYRETMAMSKEVPKLLARISSNLEVSRDRATTATEKSLEYRDQLELLADSLQRFQASMHAFREKNYATHRTRMDAIQDTLKQPHAAD